MRKMVRRPSERGSTALPVFAVVYFARWWRCGTRAVVKTAIPHDLGARHGAVGVAWGLLTLTGALAAGFTGKAMRRGGTKHREARWNSPCSSQRAEWPTVAWPTHDTKARRRMTQRVRVGHWTCPLIARKAGGKSSTCIASHKPSACE